MKSEPQPTIFVIDDDASMRRALSYLLLSAGFKVETYSSAEEFLTREHYDGVGCIILDVQYARSERDGSAGKAHPIRL